MSGNILLLILSLCSIALVYADNLPLLMWQSKSTDVKQLPALCQLKKDDFKYVMEEQLKTKRFMALFIEQDLSLEDFSLVNQNVFNKFTELSKDSNTQLSFVSSVESAVDTLKSLVPEDNITEAKLTADGVTKELKVERGNMYLLELSDARENENRMNLLQRHAKLIVEKCQQILEEDSNAICVYTSYLPSWVSASSNRKARHLLETDELSGTGMPFFTKDVYFLYLSDSPLFKKKEDKDWISLTGLNFSSSEGDKNIFVVGQQDNITMNFTYVNNMDYWILQSIELSGVYIESGTKNILKPKDAYAPIGFSYYCDSFTLSNAHYVLTLRGFQIQLKATQEKFGDAYDCVGFMTVPIWSGIFVTLILAIIMTIGLSMMMDIKTMDRFDDPKGKTITVNVSE